MSEPSFTPSSRGAFSYHWNQSINNHDSCVIKLLHSIKGFMEAFFTTYTISVHDIDTTYLNKQENSLHNHSNSFFYKEYVKSKKINVTIINENKKTSNTDTDNDRLLQAKEDAMMKELSEIEKHEISADEFIEIMLKNNFKDSLHYIVTGDINLSCDALTKKGIDPPIHLPKYFTVKGDMDVSLQDTVHSFPDIFIVTGNLTAFYCFGINDLSKTKLKVGESVDFSFCSNMVYAPNQIFAGKRIIFFQCQSMINLPDQLKCNSIDFSYCKPEIAQYFNNNKDSLYQNIRF